MNPSLTAIFEKNKAQAAQAAKRLEFLGLYDEFFARIYNYIYYRCNDAALSDDLTGAVFEKALAHFDEFDPQQGSFGGWAFTIARNEVNMHLRKEMRQIRLPMEALEVVPGSELSPEDMLIRVEAENDLLEAMEHLTERERDLLALKFAGRFSNRRMAEITGLSESHVGVIVFRALGKLRARLESLS